MSEPLIYCATCGKPRVKGDFDSWYCCSEECDNKYGWNYCIICGKKTNDGNASCSKECLEKNIEDLWKKLNE
jgi:predicted nucleic acid-binding Zn ribbon protein